MRSIFRKFKLIAICTLLILVYSQYSFAQVKELRLRVDGLACPFCAYGLEKKLKSLRGLESLDISLKKGIAVLVFKSESEINLSRIKTMVKDAGYTLRNMKITASGYISEEGDNFLFKIKGIPNKFYIFEEKRVQEEIEEGKSITTLAANLKEKLKEFLIEKTQITITGTVHSHSDGSFGLSIEEYSVAKEEK
jgi:mercuric ion binding protein